MKKKLLVLVCSLFVIGASNLFAFGIGLQLNADAGRVFAPGAALTFKLDTVPLVFAANWYFGEDSQNFGLTGDYWVLNNPITNIGKSSLNYFFGVGFFANIATVTDQDVQFAGGLRIPLGLNMYIAKGFFEPFIMIAPSFGLRFIPSFGATDLFWPWSIGFRMWFK